LAVREPQSERTCIVTGEEGSPESMLRFALSGEGVVTPDILRKLPGRGVWTQLSRPVVRQAAMKQAFARGFRKAVRASAELADDVDRLLETDALQFLSLVNKAGLVVAGAMKVETAIREGGVVALLHASEGSPDGAAKLDRLLQGVAGERYATIPRINLFHSSQLDLALGRTNVIHAALNSGPASTAFLTKLARLNLYRFGGERLAAAPTAAEVGDLTTTIAEKG